MAKKKSKKKITKKKITKQSTQNRRKRKKKGESKKQTRKKKNIYVVNEVQEIYKLINRVQLQGKELVFRVDNDTIIPIVKNIIEDSQLDFIYKTRYNKPVYVIAPGDFNLLSNFDIERLEDELLEEIDAFISLFED